MIPAVKQVLADLDLEQCIHPTLQFQEKGKGVKLTIRADEQALKIKVDDGLISDGSKKCDCLYVYQKGSQKGLVILVELKGKNYQHALAQLSATKAHRHFQSLLSVVKPTIKKPIAVVILSKKANINRPDKDEWELENGLRLRVQKLDDNDTFDLINIIK